MCIPEKWLRLPRTCRVLAERVETRKRLAKYADTDALYSCSKSKKMREKSSLKIEVTLNTAVLSPSNNGLPFSNGGWGGG